jgi:dihydrofolate reductase
MMSKVILDISMSLDGFVARPDDDPGPIHDWLFNGDPVIAGNDFFKTAGASTEVLNESLNTTGALVTGRHTYDLTGGWGGNCPVGDAPVFVVTHLPPDTVPHGRTSFTFVDGVQAAVEQAQRAARNKDVWVMGGASVARQCLIAGLLDEMQIHLTPVLLGHGVRLIDDLSGYEVSLEQTRVIEAPGVTHLRYRVLK